MNWPRLATAVMGFVVAAYLAFLLARVPQAASINDSWHVKETQLLRLVGTIPGDFVALNLRGTGTAAVSAGAGSTIVAPGPGTLAMLAKKEEPEVTLKQGGQIEVRIADGETGHSSVSVATQPVTGAEPSVDIFPSVQQDDIGMRIRSANAVLLVSIDWSARPPWAPDQGVLLLGEGEGQLPLERMVISVPPGKMLYIGGTAASKIQFDLGGRADHLSGGGLGLRSLEILGGEHGPVSSLACGARQDGERRAPAKLGGLHARNCTQSLHIEGLRLADQSTFALSGPGFFMKEGSVNYWPVLPSLTSNPVIQAAITALIGLLIGSILIGLGLKKEGK